LDFLRNWINEVTKPGFAVSLIFVFYCFLPAWNSAAYIVGRNRSAQKKPPKSIDKFDHFVTVVYILLQVVFLNMPSVDQLSANVQLPPLSLKIYLGPTGAACSVLFMLSIDRHYQWLFLDWTTNYPFDRERLQALWKPVATSESPRNFLCSNTLFLNTAISLILISIRGPFEANSDL